MFSNDVSNMVKDILLFKGFKESSFTDKLKWLFVLFPFFFLIICYFSIPFAIDKVKNITGKKNK